MDNHGDTIPPIMDYGYSHYQSWTTDTSHHQLDRIQLTNPVMDYGYRLPIMHCRYSHQSVMDYGYNHHHCGPTVMDYGYIPPVQCSHLLIAHYGCNTSHYQRIQPPTVILQIQQPIILQIQPPTIIHYRFNTPTIIHYRYNHHQSHYRYITTNNHTLRYNTTNHHYRHNHHQSYTDTATAIIYYRIPNGTARSCTTDTAAASHYGCNHPKSCTTGCNHQSLQMPATTSHTLQIPTVTRYSHTALHGYSHHQSTLRIQPPDHFPDRATASWTSDTATAFMHSGYSHHQSYATRCSNYQSYYRCSHHQSHYRLQPPAVMHYWIQPPPIIHYRCNTTVHAYGYNHARSCTLDTAAPILLLNAATCSRFIFWMQPPPKFIHYGYSHRNHGLRIQQPLIADYQDDYHQSWTTGYSNRKSWTTDDTTNHRP
ncbi:unnamed protein product [Mytilus edulis]|uniref:Uncharacterized protein n=1 Tax=Mytilus edulis TaxID=6550 RepID=A0A8S3V9U6_MYTED|nr:unnamed protein product [Mytilus edulis]